VRLVLFILIILSSAGISVAWEAQTFTEDPDSGWEEQTFDAADVTSAKGSGYDSGGVANDQLGSKEGLNERASEPLTGRGTDLVTLSGEERGRSNLSRASSSAYLQIFIQPGTTGDLNVLYASQDLNFDGTFDHTFSPSRKVSGICADGYVTCDPGTWNSCEYWSWGVNTGKIIADETTISGVSGCYCINNSCGTSLAMSNISQILSSLGGGAAAALSTANPNHQITQSDINTNTMTVVFYGQDVTEEQVDSSGNIPINPTVTQTDYYSRPGRTSRADIERDTRSMVSGQGANPESNYSLVLGVGLRSGNNLSEQTCLIERNITFTNENYVCSDEEPLVNATVLGERITKTYYLVDIGERVVRDDCDIGRIPSLYPEFHWVPTDGVSLGYIETPPSNTTPTGKYSYVYLDCDRRDGTDRGRYRVYEYYVLCSKDRDYMTENIGDGCLGLASDENCQVKHEEVDGVFVLRNRGATGLIPESSARTYVGSIDTHVIFRPWWQKYRTYECRNDNQAFNFEDAIARSMKAMETAGLANNKATEINYTDISKDPTTGAWSSRNKTINVPEADPTMDCDLRCKVRRPVLSTDMTYVGAASNQRANNTGPNPLPANAQWKFMYLQCGTDGCPTIAGDVIMKGCQCLNEFAEVTAVMESLNRAGKDIICSDGVRR